MALGSNTSLAYILSAIEQNHDLYIFQLHKENLVNFFAAKKFRALHLNKENALHLIQKYKEFNQDLRRKNFLRKKEYPAQIDNYCEIEISEIDFIIQRLEPMNAPFPPYGENSINEVIIHLKKIFPKNFIFNAPINCFGDKDFPLLFANFATPTIKTFIEDIDIAVKITNIFLTHKTNKIVLKPSNSAQAFGVFSVEFDLNGLNFAEISKKRVDELLKIQIYKIKNNLESEELAAILNILYFVQSCKANKIFLQKYIQDFSFDEIKNQAKILFNDKILIQPFLEGVRLGDIRISFAKMLDGDFHVIAAAFRKNILLDVENFTTGFMSGRSIPSEIEANLTKDEQNNLSKQIAEILHKLNSDLKEKYQSATEIGCDFILAGNGIDVYFGEANHHCQGLVPLAEMVQDNFLENNFYQRIGGMNFNYNGGLSLVGEVIKQQIALTNLKLL